MHLLQSGLYVTDQVKLSTRNSGGRGLSHSDYYGSIWIQFILLKIENIIAK